MRRFGYLFAILGLAVSLAAGVYAYSIENPILGSAALIVASVATGYAARSYSKHVIAPNLKKAQTSPAIRGGPLYWWLRLAMMAVALGIAGFLFVAQHGAETPDEKVYLAVSGALIAVGGGLMVGIVTVFKAANRPGPGDGSIS